MMKRELRSRIQRLASISALSIYFRTQLILDEQSRHCHKCFRWAEHLAQSQDVANFADLGVFPGFFR